MKIAGRARRPRGPRGTRSCFNGAGDEDRRKASSLRWKSSTTSPGFNGAGDEDRRKGVVRLRHVELLEHASTEPAMKIAGRTAGSGCSADGIRPLQRSRR